MHTGDTIAAISSAVGPAARMIVRLSGTGALEVASAVSDGTSNAGGVASLVDLRFAGISVPAWVYCFRAPRSYTGEDLIEFHLPGNPVLARLLLRTLIDAGARPAEPGEFTARAYFNGRMDLTEAEGVAATISAQNSQELAAARQLLAGELARRLRPAMDGVAQTLALAEVGIDFSDEDVTALPPAEARERILRAIESLRSLLADSARFERLSHEPTFVLVGRPNAGKSTLLNALAGSERAVTSDVAGTTRDALSAEVALPRGRVRVIDVAGLEHVPAERPETAFADIQHGMQRLTARTMDTADHLLLVREVDDLLPPPLTRPPALEVRTKADRSTAATPEADGPSTAQLSVSAHTGYGMGRLRDALDRLAFGSAGESMQLALNARHLRQIDQAVAALERALAVADGPAEVLAMELREGLGALGDVLGNVSPDDLLGRIFSTFCIGK